MADDSGATLADVMPEKAAGAVISPVETILAPVYERTVDEQGRSYATGKRKDAVARVWVKPGSGKISVNGKEGDTYFNPLLSVSTPAKNISLNSCGCKGSS